MIPRCDGKRPAAHLHDEWREKTRPCYIQRRGKARRRGSAGRGRDGRGAHPLSGSGKATPKRRRGRPSRVSERRVRKDSSRNKVTHTPSKHRRYICECRKPSPTTPGICGRGVTRNTETINGEIRKFRCRLFWRIPAVGCSSRNLLKSQRTASQCTERKRRPLMPVPLIHSRPTSRRCQGLWTRSLCTRRGKTFCWRPGSQSE